MQLFKSQCLHEPALRRPDYGYRCQVSGLRYGGRGGVKVDIAPVKLPRADTVVIADFPPGPASTDAGIRYEHAA